MLQDPHGTNALTSRIIGCGVHVHRAIGPGLYENVYAECLDYELRLQGLRVERERPVRVTYRGIALKSRYYADFIVEDTAIVELKAVVTLADIHGRQILTLLKLTGLPVGLLINFNVVKLTNGVRRIVNPQLVTVGSANP
jgi:GxxExxY protein